MRIYLFFKWRFSIATLNKQMVTIINIACNIICSNMLLVITCGRLAVDTCGRLAENVL